MASSLFQESFDSGAGLPLGHDLDWDQSPSESWQNVSNNAKLVTTTTRTVAYAQADLGSSDHYAELVVTIMGGSSYHDAGPAVRVSADGLTYYSVRRGRATSEFYEFCKMVNGVETVFGGARIALAFALPETLRLEVEGSDLRFYRNGVLVATQTDVSIPGGTRAGFQGYRNSSAVSRDFLISSWQGGSLHDVGVMAEFSASTVSAYMPATINFTDLSSGSTSWLWDFGDGTTSTDQHPSHEYAAAGSYTVSLTVSDGGTPDTETKTDYITITDPASIPVVTTDFDGASLPAGYTFDNPVGGATVSVADGCAVLSVPAAVADSFSNAVNPDNSWGLKKQLRWHGGDIDYAVLVNTDIGDMRGYGIYMMALGNATDAIRIGWYHADSDGWYVGTYGYARAGGVGDNFVSGGSVTTYMSGIPQWQRLRYTADTGVWEYLHSTDGVNWKADFVRGGSGTPATSSRSFAATHLKIGVTHTGATLAPKDIKISKVIDIIERGNDDLRDPVPTRTMQPVTAIAGTEGALPAEWVDISEGSSAVQWVGDKLRFDHVASESGSRSGVRFTGQAVSEWGMVFKIENPTPNSNCYFTAGFAKDQGGYDQYVWGAGYGLEIQSGQVRRPIRVDDKTDGNVTGGTHEESSTDLNELPYCHLKDLSVLGLTGGQAHWVRMEYIGNRIRMKEWTDGDAEPGAWNLIDGHDETEAGLLRPAFMLSHNGVRSGTCVVDMSSMQVYAYVDGVPLPVWSRWNGTTEEPLALDGVWNGTSIDPVSLDQVT